MNRRLNPWAVAITAALTFGSLMAFVGPRSFGNYRGDWSHGYSNHRHYGYDRDGACNGPNGRNQTPISDSVKTQ